MSFKTSWHRAIRRKQISERQTDQTDGVEESLYTNNGPNNQFDDDDDDDDDDNDDDDDDNNDGDDSGNHDRSLNSKKCQLVGFPRNVFSGCPS